MEKGTIGYINAYKKKYGGYALLLALLIVAGVLAVGLIFGTIRHLTIIIPVVLSLPFAKMLILWVVVVKFHSLSQTEGERLEAQLGSRKNCILLYDMALSAYEAVSFASCLVIDQGNIYLLWGGSNEKSYGAEQQRDYVQEIIQKTGYSYSAVTVHSVDELLEQVGAAPVEEEDLSVKCERLKQRMLGVCV